MNLNLTFGFSPCPNDTFIFDALVNGKIDTGGIRFQPVLEDVETLNKWALENKLDITKLSFPAFFGSTGNYILLPSGSALGKGTGPVMVAKDPSLTRETMLHKLNSLRFALPGLHTTANLVFSDAFPDAVSKKYMLFSEIEEAVLANEADIGILIHENRFTYQEKGLHLVMELGEWWEDKMKVPIPLGGIAIKRAFGAEISLKVSELIKESLQYAYRQYPALPDYVKEHSQTLSEEVMRNHIELYVNNYSIDLGNEGKNAITTLYKTYLELHPQSARCEDADLFL